MARLSLSQSPKFKVLIRTLKIPISHLRGHLELLWESSHFRDNPFFASFDEIEATADWQGEDGVFAQALLDRHWIDEFEGGFNIHDYEEHLPSYVKERRRKALYRKTKQEEKSQDIPEKTRDNPESVPVVSRDNPTKSNGMERNVMKCNERKGSDVSVSVIYSPDAMSIGEDFLDYIQDRFKGSTIKLDQQIKYAELLIKKYGVSKLRDAISIVKTDRFFGDNVRSLKKLGENWKNRGRAWILEVLNSSTASRSQVPTKHKQAAPPDPLLKEELE